MSEAVLWHVTLTVAGSEQEITSVRAALERLSAERPFFLSGRYAADRAELCYWEEAHDCSDACALALRLWWEHRESARLPPWNVTALEVLSRTERQRRDGATLSTAHGWRPFEA